MKIYIGRRSKGHVDVGSKNISKVCLWGKYAFIPRLILEEKKKYCETALTKSITLNDETMYLSEYLLVNLPTI